MLLRLLELDATTGRCTSCLGFWETTTSPRIGPTGTIALAGLAERTIRTLQIPRGRQAASGAVGSKTPRRRRGTPATRERVPRVPYRIVHGLLQCLAEALDQLPRFDTLGAHALAWTRLADRVGILRSMRDNADQAAWNQLHQTLRGSSNWRCGLVRMPRDWTANRPARPSWISSASQTVAMANEEPGRVRVLSAASARHLRIPYLFLAGLSEKSFPAADRDDGVYSEAEHQRLIEAGLPLPSRSDRQTDEMLLFYETITAATRRLYLSYPAVDESGEPLTPSPYLKEVEQACGADADRALRADRSQSRAGARTIYARRRLPHPRGGRGHAGKGRTAGRICKVLQRSSSG